MEQSYGVSAAGNANSVSNLEKCCFQYQHVTVIMHAELVQGYEYECIK